MLSSPVNTEVSLHVKIYKNDSFHTDQPYYEPIFSRQPGAGYVDVSYIINGTSPPAGYDGVLYDLPQRSVYAGYVNSPMFFSWQQLSEEYMGQVFP